MQEFFSETTSSVDVVVAESPTSPVTVRQLSCPPGANHAQTTPTATPTAAADGGDGNDDDDESASHKRTTSSSSSSSPAPSTWIAFKVCLLSHGWMFVGVYVITLEPIEMKFYGSKT